MMSHSIIPPSSAGIWGKPGGCTAWVLMNQCYPELEESPESREGTASHEIAAELITNKQRGFHDTPWSAFEGRSAPNGVIFTEEMFDGAAEYAKHVGQVMRDSSVFGGPSMGVEQRLEIPCIHELSFGTCDCFIYDESGGNLYIWDYKFGYEVVEAYENWQLINYAAGIFDLLGIDGVADQYITVHMIVAQPRAFHRQGSIREWKVKGSDLRAYFNILRANAEKALGPNAEANTDSHCKHCPGRHACEAALTAGTRLYEAASKPVPVELSPQALGVQLTLVRRARKQLEYLESGYEEQVKQLVKSGATVPGWGTEPTYGREKWDKQVEEVIVMGDMLGHDLRKPQAKTPNQARKLGVDDSVITAYSTQPRTGLAIVPDNGTKAKQVFTQ